MSLAPARDAILAAPTPTVERVRRLKRITRDFQVYIGNQQAQLANLVGFEPATVCQWFRRGRISVAGADAIGRKFKEWPRERLRPDVLHWESALKARS